MELVVGGSVIDGAYPVYFLSRRLAILEEIGAIKKLMNTFTESFFFNSTMTFCVAPSSMHVKETILHMRDHTTSHSVLIIQKNAKKMA